MAKVAEKANVAASSEKRIPLKLKVSLESYTPEDGKERAYVQAVLVDPFPEYAEEFNNVRIAPRWDKDAAVFSFRMKVYLKTHDDVMLDGYCVPVGFESKKDAEGKPLPEGEKGEMIHYPGIFFDVFYRGEPVEFGFKPRQSKDASGKTVFTQSADSYVFRDIVAEKWGGSFAPAESAAVETTVEGLPF